MRLSISLLAFLCSACDVNEPGGPPGDGLTTPTPPGSDGGQFTEEDTSECEVISAESLQMDEVGPHGWTGDAMVAAFGTSHDVTLTWADDGATTPMSVILSDVRDPRRLERQTIGSQTDLGWVSSSSTYRPCGPVLALDAVLQVRTDDGAFDESFEIELLGTGSSRLSVDVFLEPLAGTFDAGARVPGTWDTISSAYMYLSADQGIVHGDVRVSVRNELPYSEEDQEAQVETFVVASFE